MDLTRARRVLNAINAKASAPPAPDPAIALRERIVELEARVAELEEIITNVYDYADALDMNDRNGMAQFVLDLQRELGGEL
jgi:hypothetical protein